MSVKIHTSEDFKKMRVAGRLAAETLDYITEYVVPGATTGRLNDLCHERQNPLTEVLLVMQRSMFSTGSTSSQTAKKRKRRQMSKNLR